MLGYGFGHQLYEYANSHTKYGPMRQKVATHVRQALLQAPLKQAEEHLHLKEGRVLDVSRVPREGVDQVVNFIVLETGAPLTAWIQLKSSSFINRRNNGRGKGKGRGRGRGKGSTPTLSPSKNVSLRLYFSEDHWLARNIELGGIRLRQLQLLDQHGDIQGRSENGHYFGLFNIIVSQISPEIISIIRDASQLSKIMTKPSRIRFFFEK